MKSAETRPLPANRILAHIVAAKEVRFDPGPGTHHLREVLNRLEVPAFPCIATVDVLVKLSFAEDRTEEGEIRIVDEAGQATFRSPCSVRNVRGTGWPPGCDLSMRIRFLAEEEGFYAIEAAGADGTWARYPLYVGHTDRQR